MRNRIILSIVIVLSCLGFNFQSVSEASEVEFKDLTINQIINQYYSERDLDGVEGLWIYGGEKGPVLIAVLSGAIPEIENQYGNKSGFVGIMLQPDSSWGKGQKRFSINKVLTPHEKYKGAWQGTYQFYVYGIPVKTKKNFNSVFTLNNDSLTVESEAFGTFPLRRMFPARNPAPGNAGTGSGFFVSPNLVVTNHHVVDSAKKVEIRTKDGKWAPASVVIFDADYDIAILEVSGLENSVRPLTIGDTGSAKVGQRVYSFGFPDPGNLSGDISAMQLRMNEGIITSLQGYKGSEKELQVSIPTTGGNSGGPVVNAFGEPIAIITSKLLGHVTEGFLVDVPQNINFARRIERVVELVQEVGRSPELSPANQQKNEVKTEIMADQMQDSVVLVRSEGYKRSKTVSTQSNQAK